MLWLAVQLMDLSPWLGTLAAEALDLPDGQGRLEEILREARAAALRPADLRAMQDLANVTAAKLPEFNKPAVVTEFLTAGPMKLYTTWLEAISSQVAGEGGVGGLVAGTPAGAFVICP